MLDGVVLVISAVEGVQSQTLVLMRALPRLRIATLLHVNKIDRAGADDQRVLQAVAERLAPAVVPIGQAHDLGTRAAGFTVRNQGDVGFRTRLAEALAERDDGILAAYVEDEAWCPVCQAAKRPRRADEVDARASRLLRLGGHGRGRRTADGGHRRAPSRPRGRLSPGERRASDQTRTTPNPLNREEYRMHLARRVSRH